MTGKSYHNWRCGALAWLLACVVAYDAGADDQRATSVGLPARIDQLVLPGPELEAVPVDAKAPIVLRVLASYPHGTAFRYDLAYYGLDPGSFDLKDYLRRKDGTHAEIPSILVKVEPLLPAGQIVPNPLKLQPSPRLGGYRLLLIVASVLWTLGLLAILFLGRRKALTAGAGTKKAPTLADKLRPLVVKAMNGSLTSDERADLERTLLAFWRGRLNLGDQKPAETFALLRQDREAGPLLDQLEIWLHRPGPAATVDVAALLKPYQAEAPAANAVA